MAITLTKAVSTAGRLKAVCSLISFTIFTASQLENDKLRLKGMFTYSYQMYMHISLLITFISNISNRKLLIYPKSMTCHLPKQLCISILLPLSRTSGIFQRQIRLTSWGLRCYAEKWAVGESRVQSAETRKKRNRNYKRQLGSHVYFQR